MKTLIIAVMMLVVAEAKGQTMNRSSIILGLDKATIGSVTVSELNDSIFVLKNNDLRIQIEILKTLLLSSFPSEYALGIENGSQEDKSQATGLEILIVQYERQKKAKAEATTGKKNTKSK